MQIQGDKIKDKSSLNSGYFRLYFPGRFSKGFFVKFTGGWDVEEKTPPCIF